MPQAGIVTFGCKVNQYESAFLAETLSRRGWQLGPLTAAPELIVVNTCTVTARADQQARQYIRRLGRQWPEAAVLVTGCYAQRAPAEVAALPGVRWVLGNQEKTRIIESLESRPETAGVLIQVEPMASARFLEPMPITRFFGHTRAFVKIQDGCQNLCSYCILPLVRGPRRSLPRTQVIAQLRQLASRGYQEVVLTGINLGQYGQDLSDQDNLSGLVPALAAAGLPFRYRLSSIEPQEITPALIQALAGWPQFCPHFHIPLQSGSTAVLKAMQRPYGPKEFRERIEEIFRAIPQAALGVDVIVGFPGETAADFVQTQELIQTLPIAYLHVFLFSPRPETLATRMPQTISRAEVKRRAQSLRDLGRQKKAAFYQRHIGQKVEVLIEGLSPQSPGWLQGISANYLRVALKGPPEWTNRLIRARVVQTANDRAIALPW